MADPGPGDDDEDGKAGRLSTRLEPKFDDGLNGLTVEPAKPVGCGCKNSMPSLPPLPPPPPPKLFEFWENGTEEFERLKGDAGPVDWVLRPPPKPLLEEKAPLLAPPADDVEESPF